MDDDAFEPEHVLCRRWRVEKMELTRDQLSALTGFSASMIKDYERPDKMIDTNARKRYRMACAAVEFGIDGDWLNRTLVLARPAAIMIMPDGRRKDHAEAHFMLEAKDVRRPRI